MRAAFALALALLVSVSLPAQKNKPANSKSGTERYTNKEGAYSVNMVGNVTTKSNTPIEPSSEKPFRLNLSMSTDAKTSASYLVRYNDFPAGYVSISDSSYLHSSLKAIADKMSGIQTTYTEIELQGNPAMHVAFFSEDQSMKIEAISLLRGERFYLLMTTRIPESVTDHISKDFFDSFKFIPFEKPVLKEVTFPEGFTLKVPKTFEEDSSFTREDESATYAFNERLSGKMYLVVAEIFSKYDQADKSNYFSKMKDNLLSDSEGTYLTDSTVYGNKQTTHNMAFKKKKDNSLVKVRSVLAGNSFISLWSYTPVNEYDPMVADQIFDSFSVKSSSDWDLFADKSDILLEGLLSPDSIERVKARSALRTYEFKKEQLPKIYAAINKNYFDDNEQFSYGVKDILIDFLKELNDNTTQPFLEKYYSSLHDTSNYVEPILGAMYALKHVNRLVRLLIFWSLANRITS